MKEDKHCGTCAHWITSYNLTNEGKLEKRACSLAMDDEEIRGYNVFVPVCYMWKSRNGVEKPMTNADKIRKMSDTELAKFIRAIQCNFRFGADCGYPACPQMEGKGEDLGCNKHYNDAMLEWLKKEVQHE